MGESTDRSKGAGGAAQTTGADRGAAPPYIVCLKLHDELTCVVGGGKVAARKVESLLEAGARVHLIADRLCDDLRQMRADPNLAGRLSWDEGPYRHNLPAGTRLVIACTDDRAVNRQVLEDSRSRNLFCNVVDDLELCDFIVPAVRRVGPVQVAVSTGGASPTLARELVEAFVRQMEPRVADLAQLLAEVRLEVQGQIADTGQRKELFQTLCGAESRGVLAERGEDGWRQWYRLQLARYQR